MTSTRYRISVCRSAKDGDQVLEMGQICKAIFSKNIHQIQIQDIFENGKPEIFLKTVKRFNIKRTHIINLIPKKSLKLRIVVLFMFNKMLVTVFTIDIY